MKELNISYSEIKKMPIETSALFVALIEQRVRKEIRSREDWKSKLKRKLRVRKR